MGADTLLGNDVCNRDGEDLGDIKEFMIDKNRWPAMSDRTWASGVHKFYGTPCGDS